MVVLWCCGAPSLKGDDRFPVGPRAVLRWFQSGRNRLGRMKKVCLFSNWHGGVMVNAVMYKAHGGEDRFPAGPRVLLSWFQSGRNQLGRCNRFEELKQVVAKGGFHSVQNVARSIFSERFLLKCLKSTTANEIIGGPKMSGNFVHCKRERQRIVYIRCRSTLQYTKFPDIFGPPMMRFVPLDCL